MSEIYCATTLAPLFSGFENSISFLADSLALLLFVGTILSSLSPAFRWRVRQLSRTAVFSPSARAALITLAVIFLALAGTSAFLRFVRTYYYRISQGSVTIRHACTLDLDSGDLAPPEKQADLWFQAESVAQEYLVPRNGAAIALMDDFPSPTECVNAPLSEGQFRLRDAPIGSWFCYRTSDNRTGRFYVETLTAEPRRYVTIRFETW